MAGLLLPRGLVSQQGVPFSDRGRAVAAEERDVLRKILCGKLKL